jgi:phenylalanyl-tRNA synthetase alpha chain
MVFQDTLNKLHAQAIKDIQSATADNLPDIRLKYLGRKSELNELLSRLKELPESQKAEIGKLGNVVKQGITKLLTEAEAKLAVSAIPTHFDPTIPGPKLDYGHRHPVSSMVTELVGLFAGLGFSVAEGPEVELEEYNFNLLNIPANHPARDEWDTFWIKRKEGSPDNTLLRTHTSPVQLRYMQDYPVPIRVIAPGRTFRFEAEDSTHSSVFNQLEGLMVDRGLTVGNLKAMLETVFKTILGDDIELRLRPSFFPFTEPSFEVDVKFRGMWLELGGAGMVHPTVLRNANIDPDVYSGFAFGLGIDRLVMLKHDIKDVRLLLSGNLEFLKQF